LGYSAYLLSSKDRRDGLEVQLVGHIKDDNFAYYCVQQDVNNYEWLEKEKMKEIAQTQPKVFQTHLNELPKPDVLSVDKVLTYF
ncbi:MAG: hypothetical protein M3044_13885, partial [Thermoproteota archaeon]|nr:hypothetical protein [Thermoproteota archaeon]